MFQQQIIPLSRVDDFVNEIKRYERKEDFLQVMKLYEQKYFEAWEQQANANFPAELQKPKGVLEQGQFLKQGESQISSQLFTQTSQPQTLYQQKNLDDQQWTQFKQGQQQFYQGIQQQQFTQPNVPVQPQMNQQFQQSQPLPTQSPFLQQQQYQQPLFQNGINQQGIIDPRVNAQMRPPLDFNRPRSASGNRPQFYEQQQLQQQPQIIPKPYPDQSQPIMQRIPSRGSFNDTQNLQQNRLPAIPFQQGPQQYNQTYTQQASATFPIEQMNQVDAFSNMVNPMSNSQQLYNTLQRQQLPQPQQQLQLPQPQLFNQQMSSTNQMENFLNEIRNQRALKQRAFDYQGKQ